MTVPPSTRKYNEYEKAEKQNDTKGSFKMTLAVGLQETKQELLDGGQSQTLVLEPGKSGMQRDVSAKWN